MTKKLNNDYLLSKVMSFLSGVLVLLGFTSCGDDEEKPGGLICLYGTPPPSVTIVGKAAGLVVDSIGKPISN